MGKTLVIIGNGFDKSHGYRTGVQDFIDNLDASTYRAFEEKRLSMDWSDPSLPPWWSEYEKRIGEELATIRTADGRLRFDASKLTWDDFLDQSNKMYGKLTAQIADYLSREYANNVTAAGEILDGVRKIYEHPSKVFTVSFNHTETAQRYTSQVYHIHGSLSEHNIVLGYDHVGWMSDYRLCDLSDVDEWKLVRRNKRYLRIIMEFQRYCKGLRLSEKRITEASILLERFLENRDISLSGEPLEVDPKNEDFRLIQRFLRTTKMDLQNGLLLNIPFQKIHTIAVLGHSLSADQRLLDAIFSKCCHVRKIIIFRYREETQASWDQKAAYFKRLSVFTRHKKKRSRVKIECRYY